MSISNEFAMAVKERNRLRVKIMLKDSLLVDKTFRLFDEMQLYATNQGLSPWENPDPDIPLEKAEKPWTEDTMNYELTALINDFTKEHVDYIKEIISDIYKSTSPSSYMNNAAKPPSYGGTSVQTGNNTPYGASSIDYLHATILDETKNITRLLRSRKDELTGKRKWYDEDIIYIKRYAKRIVEACDEIIRRG